MQKTIVRSFDSKYLDLVKHIDRGEHSLAIEANQKGGDSGSIKMTFDDGDIYGMIHGYEYLGHLRINVVFAKDPSPNAHEGIVENIQNICKVSTCPEAYIWCSNTNPILVDVLKARLGLEEDVYSAVEFEYPRHRIDPDVELSPLVPCDYSGARLDDICALLDGSFARIAPPGSFSQNKKEYRDKFSRAGSTRFEGFLFEDTLMGMYYHNNAEIEFIAVAPGFQNRGFGAIILKRALSRILGDSQREPHLYCVDINTQARRFYERNGGRITGWPVRLHKMLSHPA